MAKWKSFPGNEPQTVDADPEGTINLLPETARIYGPSLKFERHGKFGPFTFERKFANLGFWHSPNDHVKWEVNVSRRGKYRVTLDYACDPDSDGNRFALSINGQSLTKTVSASRGWDNYREMDIGDVELQPGVSEIIIRPIGSIRKALMKLRRVRLRREAAGETGQSSISPNLRR